MAPHLYPKHLKQNADSMKSKLFFIVIFYSPRQNQAQRLCLLLFLLDSVYHVLFLTVTACVAAHLLAGFKSPMLLFLFYSAHNETGQFQCCSYLGDSKTCLFSVCGYARLSLCNTKNSETIE